MRSLWPLFLVLSGMVFADQAVLHSGLTRLTPTARSAEWAVAWQEPFRAASARSDPTKPQLVIVGSSRAEAILLPYLERAAGEAGLTHQVSNLGISFGTPSLILSGLEDFTPHLRHWPTGSRLIYIFSPHEMGGLQPEKVLTSDAGRVLMSRHFSPADIAALVNDVPVGELRNAMLRFAYPYSGLAQVMVKADSLLPSWLVTLRNIRKSTAINVVRPAVLSVTPGCQSQFSLLGPNVDAFERMAAQFGSSLTIVFPPRHPVARQCGAEAERAAAAFVAPILARTGGTLIAEPDDVMALPLDDFLTDSEHVVTDHGRTVVAAALARMVK